MESEHQVMNNYLPFDVYGSSTNICDNERDVGFAITSFDIQFESFIDIKSNYQYEVQIKFNQHR